MTKEIASTGSPVNFRDVGKINRERLRDYVRAALDAGGSSPTITDVSRNLGINERSAAVHWDALTAAGELPPRLGARPKRVASSTEANKAEIRAALIALARRSMERCERLPMLADVEKIMPRFPERRLNGMLAMMVRLGEIRMTANRVVYFLEES